MTVRSTADRIAGLVEQIKRDLAVLNGPPEYCSDRDFYEHRVAASRQCILDIEMDENIKEIR